jgi:hypothetical protein
VSVVKSSDLVETQLRAREQSALDLMAAEVIKIDLTPRQQAAYDDVVRFAAEVDAQECAHYDALPERVAAENVQVLRRLAAGKRYLADDVGGNRTIYFASCISVRHQVDRDVAHELELARDPDEVEGSWHSGSGYDTTAKWPNLMTLDEVEQLPAYRACQRCNPDTRERWKTADRKPKPSKRTSVGPQRIGREYQTPDGTLLGRDQLHGERRLDHTALRRGRPHRRVRCDSHPAPQRHAKAGRGTATCRLVLR